MVMARLFIYLLGYFCHRFKQSQWRWSSPITLNYLITVPIIMVNNKWWGDQIHFVVILPFAMKSFQHIYLDHWAFLTLGGAQKHKRDYRMESASPASPAGSSTHAICFDFRPSSSVPPMRLSMTGKENFDAPLCNLHWAEVNCFRFG